MMKCKCGAELKTYYYYNKSEVLDATAFDERDFLYWANHLAINETDVIDAYNEAKGEFPTEHDVYEYAQGHGNGDADYCELIAEGRCQAVAAGSVQDGSNKTTA